VTEPLQPPGPPVSSYPGTPAPPPQWQPPAPIAPPPSPGTNGFSIAALVLGIIGFVALAIVFGVLGLLQTKKRGQAGRGLAIAGLVLAGLWAPVVLFFGTAFTVGAVEGFQEGWSETADELAADEGPERNDVGSITGSGPIWLEDLTVGDCIKTYPDEEVALVPAVPCADPHEDEVYLVQDLDYGDDAAFPGDDALEKEADKLCTDELASLSSADDREYEDAGYEVTWVQPSEETWTEDGDRAVICLAETEIPRSGAMRF